ncbi:macrophage migration inhibitory factor [Fusarium pseudocircinatum]|uniref:L-dopachrome isomerase n=1 Tax=Fusarium pseudocircinatum TaxID=56676 RepID=A0A8H5KX15_9HYPO|nr:macrophage migration inhibitory factor [Fusarium pseudocircinatum]
MHLSPAMALPYIPSRTSTKPPNSKPRQKQETPVSAPAPAPTTTPRLLPGERRVKPRLSRPSLDPVLESDQRLSRDVEQIVSVDAAKVTRKQSLPILTRKRSDFFEEALGSKHTQDPGDRIRNESPVLVEIKTNVIANEFTFITELSEYLSSRYSRPASSIVMTAQHGICIQFGGSSDPCYTMTIEALARDVQTTTNKRNIALFQRHMEQALRIPPSKGFLRFVPLAEDCAGWKGNTLAGHITEVIGETQAMEERRSSIRAPRRRSSKTFREIKSKMTASESVPALNPSTSNGMSSNDTEALGKAAKTEPEIEKNNTKTLKRRKSFIHALFPGSASRLAEREAE